MSCLDHAGREPPPSRRSPPFTMPHVPYTTLWTQRDSATRRPGPCRGESIDIIHPRYWAQLMCRPCQLTDGSEWRQHHPNRNRTRTSKRSSKEGLDVKENDEVEQNMARQRAKNLQKREGKPRKRRRATLSSTVRKPHSDPPHFLTNTQCTTMTDHQSDQTKATATSEGMKQTNASTSPPSNDQLGSTSQEQRQPLTMATEVQPVQQNGTANARPGSPCESPRRKQLPELNHSRQRTRTLQRAISPHLRWRYKLLWRNPERCKPTQTRLCPERLTSVPRSSMKSPTSPTWT